MVVDTKKEAVEAFIQSTLKDHVLSEGMPRTSVDTQDAYAVVELLRSFLEKVEALEARVRAADALADLLDEAVYILGQHRVTAPVVVEGRQAVTAYRATKEGGA